MCEFGNRMFVCLFVCLFVCFWTRTFNRFSQSFRCHQFSFPSTLDMRPVYSSEATNHRWVRFPTPVSFESLTGQEEPTLCFRLKVAGDEDLIRIALSYPYTYAMLQSELSRLDRRKKSMSGSLYYQREILVRSLGGRNVDLLTISSINGAGDEGLVEASPHVSLFPSHSEMERRPPVFPDKRIVFISARVHPGEAPAQHTLQGILDFLLDEHDLRAQALRDRFVFKLIPMLNPDGVYYGHVSATFSLCVCVCVCVYVCVCVCVCVCVECGKR